MRKLIARREFRRFAFSQMNFNDRREKRNERNVEEKNSLSLIEKFTMNLKEKSEGPKETQVELSRSNISTIF